MLPQQNIVLISAKTERPRCDENLRANSRRAGRDSTGNAGNTRRAPAGKSAGKSAPGSAATDARSGGAGLAARASAKRAGRDAGANAAALIRGVPVVHHRTCGWHVRVCTYTFAAYLNVHSFSARRFAVRREIVSSVLSSPHYSLITIH